MTDLVAFVSSNEKSWAHVQRLIKEQDWEKIFLVTSDFGKNNFKISKPADFVIVDSAKPVSEMIVKIMEGLRNKVNGLEVALNLVSGSGKDHMALLSALLKLGLGFRLVAVTKEGIKEL